MVGVCQMGRGGGQQQGKDKSSFYRAYPYVISPVWTHTVTVISSSSFGNVNHDLECPCQVRCPHQNPEQEFRTCAGTSPGPPGVLSALRKDSGFNANFTFPDINRTHKEEDFGCCPRCLRCSVPVKVPVSGISAPSEWLSRRAGG